MRGSQSVISLDLRGLEVLVAEDEPVIALCLEQTLRDLGCSVLGPVSSVNETLALLGSVRLQLPTSLTSRRAAIVAPSICV